MALRGTGVKGILRDAAGRLYERLPSGAVRFVSKAKYLAGLNARRIGGKFTTAKKAAAIRRRNRIQERELRIQWGAPPRGYRWVQLAAKYPERFMDYISTGDE